MASPLRAILFDLDGTLLDTAPDMVGAQNTLRLERQLTVLTYQTLRSAMSHRCARLVNLSFPRSGRT